MTAIARRFASFEAAFAMAFEEEISGIGYFDTLSQIEPNPRCAALFAKLALIESQTVAALRPLATALGLTHANEAAVLQSGRDEALEEQDLPFHEVMTTIDRDYPAYVTEFEALKVMAPASVAHAAQLLIDHEVAIIKMARAELAGNLDSGAPLDAFLARLGKRSAT
jgi:hypothetical protein